MEKCKCIEEKILEILCNSDLTCRELNNMLDSLKMTISTNQYDYFQALKVSCFLENRKQS